MRLEDRIEREDLDILYSSLEAVCESRVKDAHLTLEERITAVEEHSENRFKDMEEQIEELQDTIASLTRSIDRMIRGLEDDEYGC